MLLLHNLAGINLVNTNELLDAKKISEANLTHNFRETQKHLYTERVLSVEVSLLTLSLLPLKLVSISNKVISK